MRSIVQITQPICEPVALDTMKSWLRLESTFTDDDALIATLITAAREDCENETSLYFIQRTVQQNQDSFGDIGRHSDCISFLRGPLQSVQSITYDDNTETEETIDPATYIVDPYNEPPRIALAYGCYWPPTLPVVNAVAINATMGYAPAVGATPDPATATADALVAYWAANVPQRVILAIRYSVAHWYQNREILGPSNMVEMPEVGKRLIAGLRLVA